MLQHFLKFPRAHGSCRPLEGAIVFDRGVGIAVQKLQVLQASDVPNCRAVSPSGPTHHHLPERQNSGFNFSPTHWDLLTRFSEAQRSTAVTHYRLLSSYRARSH